MLAEGRIRPIEIEKEVRVHTAWDLGVSDFTAIWFVQCVGLHRWLVDYYEGSGVGLNHYAQVLHDKRIQQGWKYGDHYFPHDITVFFHHSRIKPKNRDFSKALKRYFPEGFSIQRERATAICRVHPPVTDRRGRSPSLAKLKAARDRKIAAGEKVRRPQELRGSTAWRCRAGPSVTPLRSRSPADLFTLFLPNAAMSRQPAGHTKLRPSSLPDQCPVSDLARRANHRDGPAAGGRLGQVVGVAGRARPGDLGRDGLRRDDARRAAAQRLVQPVGKVPWLGGRAGPICKI